MITIAWYNIVGIVLIIALAYFLFKLFVEEEKDVFAGLYDAVKYFVLTIVTAFLILIWGGIFWW
jgi:hypothetical protein